MLAKSFAFMASYLCTSNLSAALHAWRASSIPDLPCFWPSTRYRHPPAPPHQAQGPVGHTMVKIAVDIESNGCIFVRRRTTAGMMEGRSWPLTGQPVSRENVLSQAHLLQRIPLCWKSERDEWQRTTLINSKYLYVHRHEAKGCQFGAPGHQQTCWFANHSSFMCSIHMQQLVMEASLSLCLCHEVGLE